jgi:hypothetical protein
MHTKDMLAAALREVGLDRMAERAATGHYHDYLSPLDFPELTLLDELTAEAGRRLETKGAIMALRRRVMSGEFDATKEESDAWANSPDGQAAIRRLIHGT